MAKFFSGLLFCCILTPALLFAAITPPALVPRTGQTISYAAGDDGNLQAGLAWPDPRFTDRGDGTVADNLTGLIWAKDASTPTVGTCNGYTQTWQGALVYVACLNSTAYLGYSDWLLPNINEMMSLLDLRILYPDIGDSPFTNVQSAYWSSTTYNPYWNPLQVRNWYVRMNNGDVLDSGTAWNNVWPVREGRTSDSALSLPRTGEMTSYASGDDGELQRGAIEPPVRFTDNNDGTVTDNRSGLIWLRDAACLNQNNWYSALNDANTLANGRCNLSDDSSAGDWRLPNINELNSLIDHGIPPPTLPLPSSHPFSGVQPLFYWSSSSFANDDAKVTEMQIGRPITGANKLDSWGASGVWPVRGGQTRPLYYNLKVIPNGNGDITADRGPLSWNGNTGMISSPPGTIVTLTAAADPGYRFTSWSGACTGTDPCVVTMSAPQEVSAAFASTAATGVTLVPTQPSPQPAGTAVTFTGAATGGGEEGTYEYRFWYRSAATSTYTLGRQYAASPSWSWDTAALALPMGTYYVAVEVRSLGTTVLREARRALCYHLGAAAPATAISLLPSVASPRPIGTALTFNAQASGGDDGIYEYRFWYRSAATTTYTLGREYASSPSWSWDTADLALPMGTYFVAVEVRHSGSTVPNEARKALCYYLGAAAPATAISLLPAVASPSSVGTALTFNALASGGDDGLYEYRFWYRSAATATYTLGREYAASPAWDWDTAALTLPFGTYYVAVEARHVGSTVLREARLAVSYRLVP